MTIAPSATPSRHPQAVEVNARESRWDKDMPAYRRLRDQGLQPTHIDGAANLESRAETALEVERGVVLDDRQRKQVATLQSEGLA